VARSRRLGAALVLAAAVGLTPAAELCEGCWEFGGRGAWLSPSSEAGTEPAAGAGAFAAFRFRPFWSVEFSLDAHPTKIGDGADETLAFLSLALEYTFRAAREQRTRPYLFFTMGMMRESVQSDERSVRTAGSGMILVRSEAAEDNSFTWGLGGGGLTSFGKRSWLRYEARLTRWATFGIGQQGWDFLVGVGFTLGY